MSCDPERITAYVDRELAPWLERALERHLAACPACAVQAAFEIEVAETLSQLASPRLREGYAAHVLTAVFSERALQAP